MANLDTSLKNQQFFCHIYLKKKKTLSSIYFWVLQPRSYSDRLPVWMALNPFILITNLLLKLCKEIQEIGTYFIPLRCIMLMMMVALMKNNMKKSTISAKSLWKGEGMLYSRPGRRRRLELKYIIIICDFWLCFVVVCKISMGQIQVSQSILSTVSPSCKPGSILGVDE